MRAIWLWLLLVLPALAQPTVGPTLQAVQTQTQSLLQTSGNLTWGQQQAVADLHRLEAALSELKQSLDDPAVTPSRIHPLIDNLTKIHSSLRSTLPFLGPTDLLTPLGQLTDGLRRLESRFNSKAQPQGPLLGSAPLTPEPLEYANPAELAIEARSVLKLGEILERPRWNRPGRGGLQGSNYIGDEMVEFVRAADRYQTAATGTYDDVSQTVPYFQKLWKAYQRASLHWAYEDTRNWAELEKSMKRLDAFYRSLGYSY